MESSELVLRLQPNEAVCTEGNIKMPGPADDPVRLGFRNASLTC